jgi:hypothetical protein
MKEMCMSSSPKETDDRETAAAPHGGQHSVSVPFFFISEFDPASGYVGAEEPASATPVSCNGNCTCGGKPKPETDDTFFPYEMDFPHYGG